MPITKEVEALVKLRDSFSMAAEALNEYIDTLRPSQTGTFDPEKVKWDRAEGANGLYERSNDSTDNPDYKELLHDLSVHGGKVTRDGYFYWIFTDQFTCGRKRK